jgi:hypothetical protein
MAGLIEKDDLFYNLLAFLILIFFYTLFVLINLIYGKSKELETFVSDLDLLV